MGQSSPTIIFHFIAEHHTHREWQGEKVVEGSEDAIRTYSFVAAFQREFEDDTARWKIADFRFNGPIVRHQLIRHIQDTPDYRSAMVK